MKPPSYPSLTPEHLAQVEEIVHRVETYFEAEPYKTEGTFYLEGVVSAVLDEVAARARGAGWEINEDHSGITFRKPARR
jgi:hypothetical protein